MSLWRRSSVCEYAPTVKRSVPSSHMVDRETARPSRAMVMWRMDCRWVFHSNGGPFHSFDWHATLPAESESLQVFLP